MVDFNKPDLSSTKSAFPGEVREAVAACATMNFDSDTNVPSGTIRFNTTLFCMESWNGSVWTRISDFAGTIKAYGGAAAPSGHLLCDGTAVSRTTYADLFTAIGTAYGAGNGTTTFNLPDLRQRFPLGKAAAGTGSTLGGTGGAIDHVHSGPSHTHGLSSVTANAIYDLGSGFQAYLSYKSQASANWVENGGLQGSGSFSEGATQGQGITLSGSPDASGTGNTGTANPPFQTVNYIIKI